jgi:peptide-methionine (R)-S-oxide reductase
MKKALIALALLAASCSRRTPEPAPAPQEAAMKTAGKKMSEQEFKKKLSPSQYEILREGGTETPGSGQYLNHWKEGIYACAACGNELYTSKTKYESHCGWPSFWDEIAGSQKIDPSSREAVCAVCGSHLGHVFGDGPAPTGKRY